MRDQKIPEKVVSERGDKYAASQRRAFIDGFKAGISESNSMSELREWASMKRDEAEQQYQESGQMDALGRRAAYLDVLIKLSEMGCGPDSGET